MARNPKDLVVSYYQFHRSLRTMSYRGTFQEFCRRFMNDKRKCASRVDVTAVTLAAHCPPARACAVPTSPSSYDRRVRRACSPHSQEEKLGLRGDRKLVQGRSPCSAEWASCTNTLLSHHVVGALRSSPMKSISLPPWIPVSESGGPDISVVGDRGQRGGCGFV